MPEPIRIYVTPEEISADEPRMVTELLSRGWDWIHLRHPEASLADMRRLIEAIPQRYHSRLRLHGHFALAAEFNLGGLHLNRRCPKAPPFYSGPVSRSCHSIEEVRRSTDCDFVTLSPVFDSVSKPGYRAAFSPEELAEINDITAPDVIALGGITPQRLQQLSGLGFAGYAVKGAIAAFLKLES